MNVLLSLFDASVNQFSRVCPDTVRNVKQDEKGTEVVSYDNFDSASYQKSLGFISDWSLSSLLAAGIDPRFGVQTSFNSRYEGVKEIERVTTEINNIVDLPKQE